MPARVVADARGHGIHDSAPFYDTYVCADGHCVTLGAIEPQFYALMLATLDLTDDADFAGSQWDKSAWPARRARLAALFLAQPRAYWQALLEPTDVCFGAVLSPVEAAQHPHMRARGVYSEHQGALQAAPAPRFDGATYVPGDACAPGAHTRELMQQLASQGPAGAWRA